MAVNSQAQAQAKAAAQARQQAAAQAKADAQAQAKAAAQARQQAAAQAKQQADQQRANDAAINHLYAKQAYDNALNDYQSKKGFVDPRTMKTFRAPNINDFEKQYAGRSSNSYLGQNLDAKYRDALTNGTFDSKGNYAMGIDPITYKKTPMQIGPPTNFNLPNMGTADQGGYPSSTPPPPPPPPQQTNFKKGGHVKAKPTSKATTNKASSRGDGIAQRGKTRGTMR
jgi:hypothetical protein